MKVRNIVYVIRNWFFFCAESFGSKIEQIYFQYFRVLPDLNIGTKENL